MIPLLASIPSPSRNVIEIGPLTIHFYGIMIAIGVSTPETQYWFGTIHPFRAKALYTKISLIRLASTLRPCRQ